MDQEGRGAAGAVKDVGVGRDGIDFRFGRGGRTGGFEGRGRFARARRCAVRSGNENPLASASLGDRAGSSLRSKVKGCLVESVAKRSLEDLGRSGHSQG